MNLSAFKALPLATKQYLLITSNYWAFTLTDGALRMLVVLHFYQLGYSPLNIALLFLFYEFFGVITNLVGGLLGAKVGLNKTMNIGLTIQVLALVMLTVPNEYLTVFWVMLAQALSGIAKDLNKMSAKSSIKTLVQEGDKSGLFKWVALLTGSKNALKGIGFFLGAYLLSSVGFTHAMWLMASVLMVIALLSMLLLKKDLGKSTYKPKFTHFLSNSSSLNFLALSRLTLFAARDVWFVVALPVFLSEQLNWAHEFVGVFLACWVILYGIIQTLTPKVIDGLPNKNILALWAFALVVVTGVLSLLLFLGYQSSSVIVIGLLCFGAVFAVNSSLHSYVIIALAKADGVSMDVGFYYMANASGRLLGTILSGFIYQIYGLGPCLAISAVLAMFSGVFIKKVNV